MGRSQKPRRAYKPKASGLPIAYSISADAVTALQLMPHAELMKFREGVGDEGGWHGIIARLNVGQVLAGGDDAISMGLASMLAVWDRFKRTNKWGGSEAELAAIGAGLLQCDALQQGCTRRQLRDAVQHVFHVATV